MKKSILGLPNGSLKDSTLKLFKRVGVSVELNGRKFIFRISNSNLFSEGILMRPQDMPEALLDGMIDVAIYGKDWHEESGLGKKLVLVTELNYSKKTNQPARVAVFGKSSKIIDNKKTLVASEYPNLTKKVFKKAKIRFSHGGTEQKVAYGKYDFGVCVVETGNSLRENNLTITKEIMLSPVVLVAKKFNQDLKYFGDLLVAALEADKYSLLKLNVDKKLIDETIQVLPALKSPTISSLSSGDCAIETVVFKENISNLIITLKRIGGTGIIVQNLNLAC